MMQKLCVWLGDYGRISRKHLLEVIRTALDEHAVWYDGNNNGILYEFLRRCVNTWHYETNIKKTRMSADAQCDGRPVEYRWHSLQKFRNSIPCTTPQSLVDAPAAPVPCINAANIGERKTWTQSEFCTWRNAVREQELPKMHISFLCIVYQPRRRPNIVQTLVGLQWTTALQ